MKFFVIRVILPASRWTKILMGKVRNNQLVFGMFIPNFRNNFERRGERRYMPKNDAAKSKIAYSPIRYFLRNSMVIIALHLS